MPASCAFLNTGTNSIELPGEITMASTYTARLKMEVMEAGANSGTWGNNTNDNLKVIRPFLNLKKKDLKFVTLSFFKTYIKDPSNNFLEFKAFAKDSLIFNN